MLVLAGGFGTRLQSIVPDLPKPLASVCGRPFIQYLVDRWIQQGITRMTFLLHHKASLMEEFLVRMKADLWRECEFGTITEPKPLGTGGAIAHAVQRLTLRGDFLVANADTWLASGISDVESSRAPSIAIVKVPNASRFGLVGIENGRVSGFEEKRDTCGEGWINAGLYKLDAGLFDGLQEQPFSLERDLFPRLVAAGELGAVPLNTEFIDIGVPEDYFRFCRHAETL